MTHPVARLAILAIAILPFTTSFAAGESQGVPASVRAAASSDAIVLKSPDGKLVASFFRTDSGAPAYTLTREGKTVVETSALGLNTGMGEIGSGVTGLSLEKTYTTDETYARRGAHAVAKDRSQGAVILVKRDKGAAYRIDTRVSDDGLAFRYELPPEAGTVKADRSEFTFPTGSAAWAVVDGEEGELNSKKLVAGDKAFPKDAMLPITVKTPDGLYATLLEADRGEFPGLRRAKNPDAGKFTAAIAGTYTAPQGAPVVTPWRVVLATPSLDRLVNADFQDSLATKPDATLFPKGAETPWAIPGRVSWSWMEGSGPRGLNLKTQKEWVDGGAKLGYEYLLVDEGWSHWDAAGNQSCGNFYHCTEKNHGDAYWKPMTELIAYAKERGMKVWLWHAYDDRFNIPGIKSPEARRAFFKKCHDAGVVGLKIDFFPAPTQEVLHWQLEALRDAAKEQLMIVFHGCGVPAGESRTYPNEMSREGIHGLEHGGGTQIPDTLCLPFNRMLAGHGDYTPLNPGAGGASTAAHIATIALINSPAMHYVASPMKIAGWGEGVAKLTSTIPLTWDETRVLAPTEIGEVAVFARRKGASWWLAVINDKTERTITVPLDFLGAGDRTLNEVRDQPGKDVRAYDFASKKIPDAAKSSVTIELKAGGGYLRRFDPADAAR